MGVLFLCPDIALFMHLRKPTVSATIQSQGGHTARNPGSFKWSVCSLFLLSGGMTMFNQYSPYMAQYQPIQGVFPPPPIQIPSQQQTPPTVVLYAPTAKDFPSVSIQPGKNALVIAQNEPFMCFKAADAMGMVQTTLYRIEQITEQDLAIPSPEYATKDEFIQLKQVVKQIVDRISPPKEENK